MVLGLSTVVRTTRIALTCLLLAATAGPARAGFTSPTLVLSSARGDAGPSGRAAAIEGSFDFPNAIQVGYPLSLVVFQGTTFVRYPATGTPVTGQSPALADGILADAELAAFVGAGTPAASSVRIVSMTPTAIRVTLPSSFTAGSATAVLFTILSDGNVLSNAIDFVLP